LSLVRLAGLLWEFSFLRQGWKVFDFRPWRVFGMRSPPEMFKKLPNKYLHRFRQQSDTGLEMELVQKYCFLSLDIFKENMDNKPIENELEAWLSFLSYDDPERILELITAYPRFKAMYQDIYDVCRNMEEVMSVYSKELEEMDRNTVQYMLETRQEELEKTKKQVERLEEERKLAEEENKRLEEEREQEKKERMLAEERARQLGTELARMGEELKKLQEELKQMKQAK